MCITNPVEFTKSKTFSILKKKKIEKWSECDEILVSLFKGQRLYIYVFYL